MPQLQVVDLSPTPRTKPTNLETTLSGFSSRFRENQVEQQETDALSDIYRQYKEEGQQLDDAIMAIQTRPGLSPTTRVNSVNQLLNLKKTNAALQAQEAKSVAAQGRQQEKIDREMEKKRIEEDLDQKEIEFLEGMEGKNLKPTEIYKQARLANIPRARAKDLASLHRMEGREARLSEKDITGQYDFELREIDRQLKDILSEKKKEPLKKQREELVKQRRADLERYRKGERDFNLAMHADEKAEEEAKEQPASEEEVMDDAFVDLLSKAFPPQKVAIGTIKWVPAEKSPDGKKRQYKSDGKKWVLVQ